MKITIESKITKSESPVETTVGTEIVLMVLESGEVYGLGETGSDVWRLIGAGTPVKQILVGLAEIYEADPSVVESDVIEMLEGLQNRKVITIS